MENRLQPHYEEDAKWLVDMGFNGVKINAVSDAVLALFATDKSLLVCRESATCLPPLVLPSDTALFSRQCGSSHNISRYAELFNQSGRPVRIENCHNGSPQLGPNGSIISCPMNMYRSGGDIHPGFIDILGKVYGSILFNDRPIPASFPGCWACEYGGAASPFACCPLLL